MMPLRACSVPPLSLALKPTADAAVVADDFPHVLWTWSYPLKMERPAYTPYPFGSFAWLGRPGLSPCSVPICSHFLCLLFLSHFCE